MLPRPWDVVVQYELVTIPSDCRLQAIRQSECRGGGRQSECRMRSMGGGKGRDEGLKRKRATVKW